MILPPILRLLSCSLLATFLPLDGFAATRGMEIAQQTITAPTSGPNLFPAAPLPGDLALGRARGKQEKPQIAAGSSTLLAVWSDTRSALASNSSMTVGGAGPYFGRGLGTMNDIYAARLDQQGNLIDQHPIVISQASYNQSSPQVSWNGQNWLVVWYQELETDYGSYQMRAVRVSPAGTILDATPLTIGPSSNNLGSIPASLHFDGTNWVVFWQGFAPSLTARSIFAARITADGTVLDPQGLAVYNHPDQFLSNPDVAFNGSGYFVVFHDVGSERVYGVRLTTTLSQVGGIFTINNFSPSKPAHPQVAANGNEYLVVWDEHPFSGNIGGVTGSRVSSTGQVLNPGGLVIDGNVGVSESFPSVVWNGTQWFVVYLRDENAVLKRVALNGAIVDAAAIPVSDPNSLATSPGAFAHAGAVHTIWQDYTADGDIQTARVSSTGEVGNRIDASLGAPRQSRPRLAFGGDVSLSVFQREVSGDAQIYGQRLDASGQALDAEPFLISDPANRNNANPSVAFNGTHFLVVWDRLEPDEFGNLPRKVRGRRLSVAAAPLEATSFPIMEGLTPDVAALGNDFLTVAIHPIGSQKRYVEATRVSGAGAVLGAPILISASYNHAPRVAAFGNRWLVVYEYHSRHDSSLSWIHGGFLDTTGTISTTVSVAVGDNPLSGGINYDDTPALAVKGDEALIVWADNDTNQNNLKGRRIQADGTLLGSQYGFIVSQASGSQLLPDVAWDGVNYVATWIDQRNELFPHQPRGDIYAARIAPDETVLDPDGFPVANSTLPEETPTVESAGGTTVFAYASFYDRAPHSAMRVTTRRSVLSPLEGVTAVSRKWHGAMGAGDVPLSLTGGLGIEPRMAGASGEHQIVVAFAAPVTVGQVQITSGVGSVANWAVNGSEVTINLTGVANAQRLVVTLMSVNGGAPLDVPMGVLLGDTNGNGSVNASDIAQARAASGQTADTSNFRAEVTLSGAINASDIAVVKAQSGTALP